MEFCWASTAEDALGLVMIFGNTAPFMTAKAIG
jgi:hypothetical protein